MNNFAGWEGWSSVTFAEPSMTREEYLQAQAIEDWQNELFLFKVLLPIKPIANDDIMLDEGVPEVQASATDIEL